MVMGPMGLEHEAAGEIVINVAKQRRYKGRSEFASTDTENIKGYFFVNSINLT